MVVIYMYIKLSILLRRYVVEFVYTSHCIWVWKTFQL